MKNLLEGQLVKNIIFEENKYSKKVEINGFLHVHNLFSFSGLIFIM